MSKNIEQIHEFQFNQRLNILKGFKEVSGTAPLPIEDLRKSLGDEPLYTVENLEKYTKDVLTKGNENDIQRAKEVLNSLSCREVIDENGYVQNMYFYVEKGHMDFAGSSGGGGRQGLVKKQITDKTGRNTTKWVRANKDEEKQEKNPKAEEGTESEDKKPEVSSEKDSGQKESLINRELSTEEYASHAAGTDSEQLKLFLQKNPNAPGAAEAKAELQKRGELDSEDEGEIDFNDAESVKNALASHPDREAIIDSAIENGITPAQALKMHESNKTDHSETHAAIDGAQAAIDALKDKTGHPGSDGDFDGDDSEDDDNGFATHNGDFDGDDSEIDDYRNDLLDQGFSEEEADKMTQEQIDNGYFEEAVRDEDDDSEDGFEGSSELKDIINSMYEAASADDFDSDEYDKIESAIPALIEKYNITEEQFNDLYNDFVMNTENGDMDLSYSDYVKNK